MTLLTPHALIWLALAVPVVLLYLWNPRTKKRRVATGFLWQRVLGEPVSTTGRALRWPISLSIHLVLLVLLVVALAEPAFHTPRRTVLILDRSASMGILTRWDDAKRLALEQLTSQGSHDRTALISFGDTVRVHCGFTHDEETIHRAIDQISGPSGKTSVVEAVDFARHLLGDPQGGRIVVISDGCFQTFAIEDVTWIGVGEPADNLAVTRLTARRNVSYPLDAQVVVEVTSFARQPTECQLDLTLDDHPIESFTLQLAAGERWQRAFALTTEGGGRLAARIDSDDLRDVDNRAETLLPAGALRHVTLVTDEGLSLRKVLESNPRVTLNVTDRMPQHVERDTILILDSQVSTPLPLGPVLVIHPTSESDLWQRVELMDDPVVSRQAADSPLLRDVRLEGLRWDGAEGLSLTKPAMTMAHPIAWTTDEKPLGYAFSRPEGRLIVLSVDIESSDLRLATAFPILMANALDWLVGGESAATIPVFDSDASESNLIAPAEWTTRPQAQPTGHRWPAVWILFACVAWVGILIEWWCFQRRWTV